jgi:hypothetical protein
MSKSAKQNFKIQKASDKRKKGLAVIASNNDNYIDVQLALKH